MNELHFHAPRSLSAKLLLAALLSLLGAVAVYLAVYGFGILSVNHFYMDADSVAARKARIYTDFNRYVHRGQISGTDADALSRFLEQERYVSITVFPAEELGLSAAQSLRLQTLDPPKRSGIRGKLYPMRFSDGIYYLSISDNSRLREDLVSRIMGLILAVFVLISLIFRYTNRLTRRIIRLSQETATVGSGDLEGQITVDGNDEIATLASDISSMRDSIIERMGNEKRAWEANSELITAMSHDIRTPMTSLIGYLGLLNTADSLPTEEGKRYLEAAYGKALALKSLTDELFKYFLVFGSSDLKLQCEDFDAHLLLMQLLGEAEFDLRDSGFTVQSTDRLEDGWMMRTDPAMLKRVIDNLISNIKKYADPDRPVLLLTEQRGRTISVIVSNDYRGSGDRMESTKIGLRTCEKIMQSLGGSFETRRDSGHFEAEFILPLL